MLHNTIILSFRYVGFPSFNRWKMVRFYVRRRHKMRKVFYQQYFSGGGVLFILKITYKTYGT